MDCSIPSKTSGPFCAMPGIVASYGLRRYCECSSSQPGVTPAIFTEQAATNSDARMRQDNWDKGIQMWAENTQISSTHSNQE